ncbi:MAG: copper chaperone PCu(A)C [Melioribacteraceae bacterium]|nr:copper chaperone PCu(A)C [Melioribacteraceae bacterium]
MKNLLKMISTMLFFLFFIGCGDNGDTKDQPADEAEKISSSELTIENPWIRPGTQNRNTALFLVINNQTNKADTLFDVEADVSQVVEVHESFKTEDDMMGMRHIEFLEIPAKSKVELKPMSFHVMLIGLNEDLAPGVERSFVLKFKNAGEIKIAATVKEMMKQ